MAWLKRLLGSEDEVAGPGAQEAGGVPGRAAVAPASTRQYGEQHVDGSNTGSFSANERLWIESSLIPVSADDGRPVADGLQGVRQQLPSWVASVLYSAGTNEALASELPPSIDVPVLYDAASRRIIAIDVDAACAELEPHRDAAVRYFKRTDSWLAPLRNAAALPGDAVAGVKGAAKEWTAAIADLSTAPGAGVCSWSPPEVEAMRRNATILAQRWQKKPKEREKARGRAQQALSLNAENVRAGSLSAADFDVLVMCEEVSTAITPEEAAAFRHSATPAAE